SKGVSSADCLNGKIIRNVAKGKPCGPSHVLTRMFLSEFRVALSHLAERETVASRELHGNFAHIQVQIDRVTAGTFVSQDHCRAEGRVPGKGQLFVHGKDAHTHATLAFDSRIAAEDESGFRQIHLAGDGLHLQVGQSLRVSEDGELVAFEWGGGKDIQGDEGECARHNSRLTDSLRSRLPKGTPLASERLDADTALLAP